ncbi:MAG: carbon monoxide dehydrogenase subunit G [Deltaproteobacteria bacterium]
MKLTGEYVFAAEVQEVWDALFDPAVLAAVLPGCEKLELVDGSYVGEIKVKIGPIQGKFTGKVDLLDQVPPKSYRMVIDGKGAQGFVKATARIVLEPQGGSTKITYDSDAQVGGKIATVGERLIETSAKAIVKQSLEGLGENVVIRAAAHRQASPSVVEPVVTAMSESVAAEPPSAIPTAPAVEYKRADASKLAGAVAKEVGKTYAPIIGGVLLVVAVVIYLIVR